MEPEYPRKLLSVYNPGRRLRSSGKYLLVTPKYNLKSYGQRIFSLTVFKSKLKTFLIEVFFINEIFI